mmetsp:Transcript_11010/g.21815  ORF Transcript_11010/g.21815 Transcript_11010/m.21815 type:complete len:131 (+) Transcript_11010:115-507(+)|eukprot:CAMPEP_0194339708 /NCGR_PEP_ID=MMETSP0171-20130528/84083_1 /TAXON_ID=218684 /ORGANISM="Corethron pennatum, Strain L29A3" /LENGTH=130 /DNA_ID=CAMNT_0039104361 /DNA_START=28 /DNA_END=420 /DNA_ORIENTATION=+
MSTAVLTTDLEKNEPITQSNEATDTEPQLQDGNGDQEPSLFRPYCPPRTCLCVSHRIAIAAIGLILAFVLLIPNAMIAASSLNGAYLGIAACWAFGVGGILGAILGRWIGWVIMFVPGLLLQICAFLVIA